MIENTIAQYVRTMFDESRDGELTIGIEYDETGKKPVGYDLIKSYYDKGWYGKKTGRGFYEYEKK